MTDPDPDPITAGVRRLNLSLSATQSYVLTMVCLGWTDDEIAYALVCGKRKAAGIVGDLMRATKTHSRVALVAEVLGGIGPIKRSLGLARKAWIAGTTVIRRERS